MKGLNFISYLELETHHSIFGHFNHMHYRICTFFVLSARFLSQAKKSKANKQILMNLPVKSNV